MRGSDIARPPKHDPAASNDDGVGERSDTLEQVDAWIDERWDPQLTVREWWAILGRAGLSSALLPVHAGGRGETRDKAQAINALFAARGVLGPPLGVGLTLVAPTIAQWGTAEQINHLLPSILDGTAAWCQLFSEPSAGSDLAGLATTAVADGDEWVVSGEKIWTSGGDLADMGLLLARTDRSATKHSGISAFAINMHQPGIEIRPLRQMTGRGGFSAVTLVEARVPAQGMIGQRGQGWNIGKFTLAEERSSYRAAGSGALITARPGTKAGSLDMRCAEIDASASARTSNVISTSETWRLLMLARDCGKASDPVLRQAAARLYTLTELARWNELRGDYEGAGNIAKLLISETFRAARDFGSLALGMQGTLWGDGTLSDGWVQEMTVFSPAPAIYGGSDQIQRNVIGERVLRLPREPEAQPPAQRQDG